MDFSDVGERLSVGSDPGDLSAAGGFDLLVLAAEDFQHYGEKCPCELLRVPLRDRDEAPTMEEIKRAQAAAEKIAYAANPSRVPYEVWQKLAPKNSPPESPDPKKVLITCEEGMNRSLWIAAMVLVLVGEQETGKSARQYLESLRGVRAFQNRHIRKLLDDYMPAWLKEMRPQPARAPGESVLAAAGGFILK
jgi:hypothetical protein